MTDQCYGPGCTNVARRAGTCAGHTRQRYLGKPLTPLREQSPARKREWIERTAATSSTECVDWPWSSGGTRGGYPQIGARLDDGRRTMAKVGHLVLIASGRPRPPAPANHMLHSCDRKTCCNPQHLRWGTPAENAREAGARGLMARPGNRNRRTTA